MEAHGSGVFWRKQDWAYASLRDLIVQGDLQPEQPLDQESIAAQLGISRVPLRHALARLAGEGLVIDRPHQKWIVAPISLADARDIYTARESLEQVLAEHAAANPLASSPDIARLERILQSHFEAIQGPGGTRVRELDRDFHIGVYTRAALPATLSVLTQLLMLSDRYIAMFLSNQARAMNAYREHGAILRAIRDGDTEAARDLTATHVRNGFRELQGLLAATNEPSTIPTMGDPDGTASPTESHHATPAS